MVHLLNSATMPRAGFYALRQINQEAFAAAVIRAHEDGLLQSSLGYYQNTLIIRQLTGLYIPVTREVTRINDGDELLIMKLPYRVRRKGEAVNAQDFEFWHACFSLSPLNQ